MDVFDLFAKISLDTSEYDKGLDDAEGKASKFGSAFSSAGKAVGAGFKAAVGVGVAAVGAATAFTGAMVSGAKETAAYGDNIDKMSQKLGMSAEAYQEWDAVMQHSGTTIDSMARGMTTLAKAAETDSDAFAQLGISQEELASMSQEDLFARTIEGLQQMEQGTERTVLAQKLLGGSAKELGALLNTSAEDTQAMRDRVHELGGVMSDEAVKAAAAFQDNLQDMTTAIDGIKRGITSDLLPSLNLLMEGFTSLLLGEEGGAEKFTEGFSQMMEDVGDISVRIVDILKQIVPSIVSVLSENLPEFVSFGMDLLMSIVDGIANNLDGALDMILNLAGIIFESVGAELPSLIDTLLTKIPEIIVKIADTVTENLPLVIDSALDMLEGFADKLSDPSGLTKIINSGVQLVVALGNGLIKAIPRLVKMIPQVIRGLVSALTENLPIVIQGVIDLVNGIVTELPNIIMAIGEALPEIIQLLADAIVQNLPVLINGVVQLINMLAENLPDIINAIIEILPQIIEAIVDAVVECLPVLIQGTITLVVALAKALPQICMALIEAIPQIIAAIIVAFGSVVDGIKQVFMQAWEGVKAVFAAAPAWFKDKFAEAKDKISEAFGNLKDKMSTIFTNIKNVFINAPTWFKDKFVAAKDAILGAFSNIKEKFGEIVDKIKSVFEDLINDALEWGKDLLGNFIKGITDKLPDLKNKVSEAADAVADFLHFSEPDKGPLSDFHTFAPDMMKLFAQGVTDNTKVVTDAVSKAFDFESAITPPVVSVAGPAVDQRNMDSIYLQKMVLLMEQMLDRGTEVVLEGDAAELFRVVEKENRISTRATGFNQLAMTGAY